VPQSRSDINIDLVRREVAKAVSGDDTIYDFNDKKQTYLTLRRRGPSVRWLVRAYGKSRTIGSAISVRGGRDFLNIPSARKRASEVYAALGTGELEPPPRPTLAPKANVWSWSDLDAAYQTMVAAPRWVNRRLKASSKGTVDDVRLAFAKQPLHALHSKALTELDRPTLSSARDQIKGHRQREKCIAYFKAAMSWAADKHPDNSGLANVLPWWEKLTAGDPGPEEMAAIEGRRIALLQAKADFTIDHLAEVLLRHEEYCAGRTAEEKISPGIRWGLWWVAHTANRRFSTVKFERANFIMSDPFGPKGWGRATWPAEMMKARLGFWLPLPPDTVHIASSSIKDWRQLVNDEHSAGHKDSRWVFASTRRIGRDESNEDVSVYPNSLNRHLQRMKEAGDLKDIPAFWLHLIRSVAGNFLDNVKGLSSVASSLMLAHTIPKDLKDEAAQTTREFYLTSQRMTLKAEAMTAWTEALMTSYSKRGGKYPIPSETGRLRRKFRSDTDARSSATSGSPSCDLDLPKPTCVQDE